MIRGINHITLSVVDIEESFQFYTKILGFRPVMRSSFSAYLQGGSLWLALQAGLSAPLPASADYSHVAFDVDQAEFEAVADRLRAHGVREWQSNRTEGDSIYFLDPNGHKLEIHAGALAQRVRSGKASWGPSVRWYD
jgi:catechol 2,3-dioxygenase-like lactoylglutathione lyase family enzyme